MMGIGMAVRPPRSRGPVLMMISALRRLGGNLWMVDNAYTGAFVDNVGTTPVTAYADLIGLTTDRLGVLGPNLVTTPSVVLSNTSLWVGPALTAGKTYQISATVSNYTGTGDVGFDMPTFAAATGASRLSGNGTMSGTLVAAGGPGIGVFARVTNSCTLSDIVVRELTGNHATQSAVASKPSVQRVPKRTRGATNLLLWSGDFSNAAWTKAGATVATGQADPFGGTAASKLVESATNSAHYFLQSVVSGTGTATSAWVVKPAGRTKIQIRSESPQTGMLATMFNLATGAIQNGTGSIVALDNGFFLCVATAPSNGTGANGYHLMQTLNDSWQETYTGDGTSGVIVHRAALFTGTVTAQQIIDNGGIPLTTTTALPNVTEWATVISFADNDFLQTGITTGNEGWVCAGVTTGSATQVILSSGGGSGTEKGAMLLAIGGLFAAYVSNGTSRTSTNRVFAQNLPQVASMGWSSAGVFVGTDGAETLPAAFSGDVTGAAPLRIGLYTGGTLPFNGPMHAVAYAPVLPSEADRATIRNGIAALQGRTL